MKKIAFLTLGIAALLTLSACCKQSDKPAKVLRHVVMFGFNDAVTPAQVAEIEKAFSELPTKIKEIKGYEWGTDCSPEGLQQGLTHCFFLTFHSDADRDAYLVAPAHKAFGQLINGKLKGVTVLDYWTK